MLHYYRLAIVVSVILSSYIALGLYLLLVQRIDAIVSYIATGTLAVLNRTTQSDGKKWLLKIGTGAIAVLGTFFAGPLAAILAGGGLLLELTSDFSNGSFARGSMKGDDAIVGKTLLISYYFLNGWNVQDTQLGQPENTIRATKDFEVTSDEASKYGVLPDTRYSITVRATLDGPINVLSSERQAGGGPATFTPPVEELLRGRAEDSARRLNITVSKVVGAAANRSPLLAVLKPGAYDELARIAWRGYLNPEGLSDNERERMEELLFSISKLLV